jgi:hypothetical protein
MSISSWLAAPNSGVITHRHIDMASMVMSPLADAGGFHDDQVKAGGLAGGNHVSNAC